MEKQKDEYKVMIADFQDYFVAEARLIGDESLSKEISILEKLAR